MTEQVLDLKHSLRALRRQWRLLAVLVAVGMGLGFIFSVVPGRQFVAGSAVLLPPARLDANGDPLRDISTESHVASSAEILSRVGTTLDPPVGADDLQRRVEVQPLSSDILEVQAEAPSPEAAELLAAAVAKEYVAYANSSASEQADTSIEVLEAQAAELDERIERLDGEIASGTAQLGRHEPGSPEALRQSALLDSLRAAQVDAARQLSSLNTQIAESRLNVELSRRGTQVLGPTNDPRTGSTIRDLRNVAIGGLVGLLTGVVAALLVEHRRPKVRARDEISDAVGAPVLASLQVGVPSGIKDYAAVLDQWTPSAVENVALRQAFTDLGIAGSAPPATVVVATLPGDPAALGLAARLAAFAAVVGTRTSFVVATRHPTATQLAAACRRPIARPLLSVHALADDDDDADLRGADLTVAVVATDTEHVAIPTWGRRTVTTLAVCPGIATAETLASTALAFFDAGHPFRGVLVANPDPSDRTTGRRLPSLPPGTAVERNGSRSGVPSSEISLR